MAGLSGRSCSWRNSTTWSTRRRRPRRWRKTTLACRSTTARIEMNTADLIAIDTHTHVEVSCRNPFDNYGEEYDHAADKYFRSSKRPTMEESLAYYREKKIGFVMFTVDA